MCYNTRIRQRRRLIALLSDGAFSFRYRADWSVKNIEKIPRHIDIDYSKYAPDIPEDQLEAYNGLPRHVPY